MRTLEHNIKIVLDTTKSYMARAKAMHHIHNHFTDVPCDFDPCDWHSHHHQTQELVPLYENDFVDYLYEHFDEKCLAANIEQEKLPKPIYKDLIKSITDGRLAKILNVPNTTHNQFLFVQMIKQLNEINDISVWDSICKDLQNSFTIEFLDGNWCDSYYHESYLSQADKFHQTSLY